MNNGLEKKIRKILIEKMSNYFNKNSFHWEPHSGLVAKYCPEYINPNKYNWNDYSWAVIRYCPENLDIKKASLHDIHLRLPQYSGMSLKEIKTHDMLNKL